MGEIMDSNKYRISLRKVTLGIIGLLFFLLLVGVYKFTKIRKQTYDNLTEALQNTMNVGILNLENNELRILPKKIGQLESLELLDLSNNELTTLPKEIGQLVNLEVLVLENNELTTLPQEIGQLRNLEVLYLHNNQLRTLPKEIGQLRNLRTLYLTGYLSNRNKLSSQEEREIQELLPKCAIE
ncbi:leucine-rich repeat domain-containing protein [Leptospira weilii]|uniref:leucine-rich repeat domain-containing protein n=1 Tax=Leptospira weilii TaxID=28184 RepID=UPI0020232BCB|nr:leucine-rich repeat domain-containing protein [Leptospira weilii]MCL8266327.1 leucine-rich repeat domain-containing protein [Leptospira weilii]